MISDIFITVPCLVMTTIAWYIRAGIALTCLIVLFAVAIGAVSVMYSTRAYRVSPTARTAAAALVAVRCCLFDLQIGWPAGHQRFEAAPSNTAITAPWNWLSVLWLTLG